MKLTWENVLLVIYKHKILSIDQINILFYKKSRITISHHIIRLKKRCLIETLRTTVGVFYFLTSKGAKTFGLKKVNKIKEHTINKDHTSAELFVLKKLIKEKKINFSNYYELLDSYKTDRELKRIKYSQLGGLARKLRWVDLLVNTIDGKIAYEIELTRKNKKRYSSIVNKLDDQFEDEKWKEINWIVKNNDINWLKKVLHNCKPTSNMNIILYEKMKEDLHE